MITPRDYQTETVAAIDKYFIGQRGSNPLVVAPTACHAKGARILMYDGTFKNVENIEVGDLLMGVDSTPRTVLKLHNGIDDLYKITPKTPSVNKDSFVVNAGHILSLQSTNCNHGFNLPDGRNYKGGDVVNISVSDYLKSSKTAKHLLKLRKSTGVEFPENKNLPIEPYFLGIILGDGCTRNGNVSVCTPDPEIVKEIYRQAILFDCNVRESRKANNAATDYFFCKKEKHERQKSQIKKALISLGVDNLCSGEKFIPKEYLINSRSKRLQLLAGLLDTDGCLSKNSNFEYSTKSHDLADDVSYLSRSLGFNCAVNKKIVMGKAYYRLSISGDVDLIPTKVKRKQSIDSGTKKNALLFGFNIDPIGKGEFFGFTLTGDHLYHDDKFFIHHNSGKSVMIALYLEKQLRDWPQCRFMMVTHQQELIEQNYEKLVSIWPDVNAGIYSAGIGRKDTGNAILFAGIQSCYDKADELGEFDVIMVDEAHMIPKKGNGMYRRFIEDMKQKNPLLKIVGFTATPYRLDGGLLYEGKDKLFDGICYDIPVKLMLERGYITPLVTPDRALSGMVDASTVNIRNGDYVQYQLEEAVNEPELIRQAVKEIVTFGEQRNSWLLFAAGIGHAEAIAEEVRQYGITCAVVTGKTGKQERREILKQFKAGVIQCLVNVNVLTTGFDAPNIDLIAMLRPTQSTALYIQMLGRGVRLADGKHDCLVLDFAGNILEHGPFDSPDIGKGKIKGDGTGQAPTKECDNCNEAVHAALRQCPFCLFDFPPPEKPKHRDFVSTLDVISNDNEGERTYPVEYLEFHLHRKPGSKDSCRVDYINANSRKIASEFLCFEHPAGSFAHRNAAVWWNNVMPDHALPLTSMNAVIVLHQNAKARISHITVTTATKYKQVIRRKLTLPKLEVN